jgi:hypothetical protein
MIAILANRWLFLSLAAMACAFESPPALQAGERVKVTLVTILATARKEGVDPRLKCIAKEICKKEDLLKGFKLVNMTCKSLATGEKWTVPLVEGQEALVVIHRGADKNNRVELKVKPPLQGDIVYQTVCGKFLPIVTRYTTKDKGDRLIVAVMVRPCHNK